MTININIRRIIEKSYPFLIAIFIVVILIVSIGRVARWDLLEQIAMADNYVANGTLYSERGSDIIHGHTVYFPGVAYLAVALKTIGIDYYLVEVMHLLSVIVLLLFIHVVSRYASLMSKKLHPTPFFYPLFIAYFTTVLSSYAVYALEFKPDTLALLLGYVGLSLIWTNKNSLRKFFIGIFLISIALVFKQQYIAFLVGLFSVSLFVKNREFRFRVWLATIFSTAILLVLISDENVRFWSIQVLSDDGILSLKEIILEVIVTSKGLLLFVILFILMQNSKESISFRIPNLSFDYVKSIDLNPWYVITLFVFGASVLSSLKVGGNSGNIQLALAVIFPIAGLISKYFVKWKMILIAWFGVVFFMSQQIPFHLKHYREAFELKNQIENLKFDDSYKVLTGSDVYYASRHLSREGVVLENYWAKAMMENISLEISLISEIESKKYDYLVIENFYNNLDFLLKSKDYEILFVNSLGIVAKLRTT